MLAHNANLVTVGTASSATSELSFWYHNFGMILFGENLSKSCRKDSSFLEVFGGFFVKRVIPPGLVITGLLLFEGVRGQSGHQNVLEARCDTAPALHFNPRTPNLAPDLPIKELAPR